MSLILDALRKSEAERRRGELPALALELPPVHARTMPVRPAWVLAPLALLAAAATVWLVQRDAVPAATTAPAIEPAVVAAPVVERVPPALPRRTLPVAAAREPQPVPEPEPMREPATAATDPETVALADLAAGERSALPPLALSMHLWSDDPARRFVILDGRRLGEGDRAGEAVVERIEPDGVILAAGGRRIRLPLP